MDFNIPSQSRWLFLASLIPETVGIGVTAYFVSVTSDLSNYLITGVAVLAFLAIIIAQYYWTFKPVLDFRDRQLSTFFAEYLKMAEDSIVDDFANDSDIRAYIMLVRNKKRWKLWKDTRVITIDHVADESDFQATELSAEYDVGQFCPGRVIEQNQPNVAISPEHESTWDEGWGTTDQQDEATGHLNVMVGAPIYRPSDDDKVHPIGVFIVDSEVDIRTLLDLSEDESLQELDVSDTGLVATTIEHAKNVGILL